MLGDIEFKLEAFGILTPAVELEASPNLRVCLHRFKPLLGKFGLNITGSILALGTTAAGAAYLVELDENGKANHESPKEKVCPGQPEGKLGGSF